MNKKPKILLFSITNNTRHWFIDQNSFFSTTNIIFLPKENNSANISCYLIAFFATEPNTIWPCWYNPNLFLCSPLGVQIQSPLAALQITRLCLTCWWRSLRRSTPCLTPQCPTATSKPWPRSATWRTGNWWSTLAGPSISQVGHEQRYRLYATTGKLSVWTVDWMFHFIQYFKRLHRILNI